MTNFREMIARRIHPEERYGLRLTLFLLALVLVAVPFGFLLDQVVRRGDLVELDTSAANHLHHFVRESPFLVSLLKLITFFGGPPWFWVLIGGVCLNLWVRRGHRLAIFLLTTTILGSVVDTIVKNAVNRDRPSLEAPVASAFGRSFPSGHAMTSTIAYGALLLVFLPIIPKKWRIAAIGGTAVLVGAIGFTRLALGVHYITDVVGGIVLGLAWLTASAAAFQLWRIERGRVKVPVAEGIDPYEIRRAKKAVQSASRKSR